jgi:hypothetical protein
MPSDRLVSYDSSYHGLAAMGGSQTVANCVSCNGAHNILPSSDPRSTINPKNLPKRADNAWLPRPLAAKARGKHERVRATSFAASPAVITWLRASLGEGCGAVIRPNVAPPLRSCKHIPWAGSSVGRASHF